MLAAGLIRRQDVDIAVQRFHSLNRPAAVDIRDDDALNSHL